ncbi:hypothetical protein ACFWU3_34085 [Streptomyces sp. NPDC058685]|uniref:hypothetical protein n=1 Tax=Streptomyces sp. NPDC058685 TaxID=3346598 RepID=UPI0036682783
MLGHGGIPDVLRSTFASSYKLSASPSLSLTSEPNVDPQMPQKVMVRKTYEAMWAEQMKAYRKANPAGTQLKKYAVLNALSLFEADLAHMRKHGTVIRVTQPSGVSLR